MAEQFRSLAALAGPEFGSQHLHDGSLSSVTPTAGDPMSSDFFRHQAHTWYTYIYVENTHKHKINEF